MGLLDNYTGVGMSPRPRWQHQSVISRLIVKSYKEMNDRHLLMLPEATVTDDWNDKASDSVIFDTAFHPLSIIEITRTEQLDAIIDKCEELMERFPEAEYIVYDYEQNVLYMYDAENYRWLSSDEYELYSQYLSEPLIEYFSTNNKKTQL